MRSTEVSPVTSGYKHRRNDVETLVLSISRNQDPFYVPTPSLSNFLIEAMHSIPRSRLFLVVTLIYFVLFQSGCWEECIEVMVQNVTLNHDLVRIDTLTPSNFLFEPLR